MGRHVWTLYCFEMKKLLKRKIVWITGTCCMLIAAFSVVSVLFGDYYVDGEKTDTHYNQFLVDREYEFALTGRKIDQTLLEEASKAYDMIPPTVDRYTLTEEYQTYARPYSAVYNFVRGITGMTISEILDWKPDESDMYARRKLMLQKEWKNAFLSEGEIRYWEQKEAQIRLPFTFSYQEGYWSLYRATTTIGLLVLFAIAICLPNVFMEEHARRTDQLILCSSYGRDEVYWAKILAGISLAIGLSLTVSVFVFIVALGVYGTEGFGAAVQLIHTSSSAPITIGRAILIMYGLIIVTSVLAGVFVMVLSEAVHSSIAALAISSALLIISMVLKVPAQYRLISQLWDWFPSTFLTPWNMLDARLLGVFGTYFTSWQAVPVIYLLAALAIVAAGHSVYRRYQVAGR